MQDVQEHSAELNFICTRCSVLCQTSITDDFTSIVWLNIRKIDLNTSKTIKHQFNARSATSNNLYMYKIHKLSTRTGSFVHSNITHGSAFFYVECRENTVEYIYLIFTSPWVFWQARRVSQNTRDEEKHPEILHIYPSNNRFIIQRVSFSKLWTFWSRLLGGTKTSTSIVGHLYSFRALFVLYRVELDNKTREILRLYRKISFGYEQGAYTIELGKGFFS